MICKTKKSNIYLKSLNLSTHTRKTIINFIKSKNIKYFNNILKNRFKNYQIYSIISKYLSIYNFYKNKLNINFILIE